MQAPPAQMLPAFFVTSPATVLASLASKSARMSAVSFADADNPICNCPLGVKVVTQPEKPIDPRSITDIAQPNQNLFMTLLLFHLECDTVLSLRSTS